MRRRFIWSVLCVLMLAIGIASAAGITEKEQLSGWVLDQAGEGVAGAQVLLLYSEDRFAAETDEAGYFHFQSVPKGLGVLVVRKLVINFSRWRWRPADNKSLKSF